MRARLLVLTLAFAALPARAQKFLPDDPLLRDPDQIPIAKPEARDLSEIFDFVANTFVFKPPTHETPAQNVNTLGDVPDSSWFTNRIGIRAMTREELARGPNQIAGPDLSRPWTIIAAKVEGITPGFTIRDGAGETFFVKVDPMTNPHMSTAAEVIGTKFFHAMGYHVPETYLATFRPENLGIGPEVFIVDEFGKRRAMTPQDLDELLKRAPREPDGSIRAVASRRLPGAPLGPFEYWGTLEDDANDIVPHEDRRELRGLRVLAAWLNHDDSRAVNSLDTYIGEAGSGFVRHHLIDFASTLGSGSVRPQDPRAGNEYMMERDPSLRSALSFGMLDRAWRGVRYPDFPEVGRFESDFFDPDRWKPEYPNPAFLRMDAEDAFWAARLVAKFDAEAIRAIVATGEWSDPKAESYVVETLLARRAKILKTYFSRVNPLDAFRIVAGTLEFTNLGEGAGVARAEAYEIEWFRFDNERDALDRVLEPTRIGIPRAPFPQESSSFLMLRIRTEAAGVPFWRKRVDVYVRTADRKIVGVERER